MPTTTTQVGRLKLIHPDLGYDGGVPLHTLVRNAWTKLSDVINSRFFTVDALLDGSSADFEHNFKTSFSELRINLYQRDTGTGELTRVVAGGVPDLADFTIIATPGALTTQVRVTNNTGAPQDIAIIVVHGKGAEKLDDLDDVDPSGAEDGQAIVYDSTLGKWKPGASGDASLKLQSITGDDLTIKAGFMILSDGRELRLASDLVKDLSAIVIDGDYYVYVDLALLPALPTDLDGREVYDLTSSQFVVITTKASAINSSQYAYVGTLQRNATVWENLQTGAVRRHNRANGDIKGQTFSLTAAQVDALLPLTHGLASIPELSLKVSDGTDYEYHDEGSYFKSDSTQIKSTGVTLESVLGAATPVIFTYSSGFPVVFVPNKFWVTKLIAASDAVNSNDELIVDSTLGALTLTLPLTPSLGDKIRVMDFGDTWSATDTVTLDGNGKNINGDISLILDVPNDSVEIVYNGTEWRVY